MDNSFNDNRFYEILRVFSFLHKVITKDNVIKHIIICNDHRSLDKQIFKDALSPYYPCIPPNTSERLIEHLETNPKDKWMLEQLCCPGCKDRFLIPKSFYQHLYRKTVLITYTCGPCGDQSMAFYNRCHLRVHILRYISIFYTIKNY